MRYRYVGLPWGQVHLSEVGDRAGALMLFLHQSPLSSRMYHRVLDMVAAQSNRPVHVVAPDTPGFGNSDEAPENWSIPDYAQGVAQLVQMLGHDTVMVIGQHTGAIIAAQLVADHDDLVTDLVLQGLPVYTPDRARRQVGQLRAPLRAQR